MVGDVLKKLRKAKGVTQDQMANLLCVKRQTYGAYERNVSVPDANTLKRLAEYFSVSADILLGVEKEKAAPEEQPLTYEQNKIAIATKGLSDDELDRVIEFVEFVKTKRKQ